MSSFTPLQIDYWEINQNCSPVLDFIDQVQPERARAKIQLTINMLADVGMHLLTNPKIFKKITGYNNLYELRISWGKTAYRILVVVREAVAHLVHAFIKQKKNERQNIRLGLQRRDILMNYSIAN